MQITISLEAVYDWFMALGLGWQITLYVLTYLVILVTFAKIMAHFTMNIDDESKMAITTIAVAWPLTLPIALVVWTLVFIKFLIFGRKRKW